MMASSALWAGSTTGEESGREGKETAGSPSFLGPVTVLRPLLPSHRRYTRDVGQSVTAAICWHGACVLLAGCDLSAKLGQASSRDDPPRAGASAPGRCGRRTDALARLQGRPGTTTRRTTGRAATPGRAGQLSPPARTAPGGTGADRSRRAL